MKKRFSAVSAVIALGLFLLLLSLRQNNSVQENAVTATGYKLNTYVTVTIYDSDNEALADECLALCDKYELIFSRTNPESELYLLNHGLPAPSLPQARPALRDDQRCRDGRAPRRAA